MSTKSLGYPADLDSGEEENEEEEGEDVERGDILETQPTQGREAASHTQTEGEVWVEEG